MRTEKEENIGKIVVDSAYTVHKAIGPGLLEKVYEICFCQELKKRGISFQRQIDVPIKYDDLIFDEAFRLDVIIEDLVICELKAVEQIIPVHEAQLLSYLKLTGKHLGYLINFNVPVIKQGIKRSVL
jgi:GxxExxY protein